MGRWRRVIVALALAGVLAAVAAAPASGGDDPEPDPLDALRALLPPGEPGEFDLQEGDGLYGQLAEDVGLSTAVADFGSGSELRGLCGGFAISYDQDGDIIDGAIDDGGPAPPYDLIDGGQAFTESNPFEVDPRGVVEYYGFMPLEGDGPRDHSWTIKTAGISLDSGGDPNDDGKNRAVGLVDLAEDLPIKFSALVKIEGDFESSIGPCIGKGFVDFQGNPLTDPIGAAAIALFAGGILGLLFNARPAMTFKE